VKSSITRFLALFACAVLGTAHAAAAATTPPYTAAQAHAGATVYTANCLQCHGANLQGTAAPAVAGTSFLNTASGDKWSLEDVRNLVFQNMPLNNPGSLTPTQYANVMAFLLASNCYPAGTTPFPSKDTPTFSAIKIGTGGTTKPTGPNGTCPVK
jgi:cytochrome c